MCLKWKVQIIKRNHFNVSNKLKNIVHKGKTYDLNLIQRNKTLDQSGTSYILE